MEHILWCEKHRPKTLEDCILPKGIAKDLASVVKTGVLPNLLLSGTPGTGKTTVAKALCNQLGLEYIFLNGSLEGRQIDTVRTKIKQFASAASFSGKRKVVIMDEADYMNAESVQPSLRNFIEEFSSNTSFIFTCNMKNRIIPALRSRFTTIDYVIDASEKPKIAGKILKRCEHILKQESIEYEQKAVTQLIINHFPDFRRVINELQRMSVSGKIDVSSVTSTSAGRLDELVKYFKDKNFKGISEWCKDNVNMNDATEVYKQLYEELVPNLKEASVPQLVLILADYQYKAYFAADQQINMLACLIEIMADCEFK